MFAFFIVADVLSGFCILIGKIAFTSKEVVPQPLRSEPASLIIGAVFVDVSNKALIRSRLILHESEHSTLRRGIVFCDTGKQLNCHRVHWAEMGNLLANLIIQAGYIRQILLDILDNGLACLMPVLGHAIADIDRSGNQIKCCIGADVELDLVETVRNQLVAFWGNSLDHLTGAMDNKQHEERLHLGKLRELLKDGLVITVRNILGKLVPDKENARLRQIVVFDYCRNPLLEGIKAIYQSPVILTNDGSGSLECSQIASVNRIL